MIRGSVPIVCVDILMSRKSEPSKVGLIYRTTFNGGFGWCLVGGAVLRDEPLLDAVDRHVKSTLGPDIELDRSTLRLCTVIEYFSHPHLGEFHDPRKHAIALTYSGIGDGTANPIGEALQFDWFDANRLADVEFGFGQGEVVRRILNDPNSSSTMYDSSPNPSFGDAGTDEALRDG